MKAPPKQNKGFSKKFFKVWTKFAPGVALIFTGSRTFNHVNPWLGLLIVAVGFSYIIKLLLELENEENL